MAVLTVTATEDYRDNIPSVANTTAITFATTTISSTARFNSIQFGAAFISDTVAITGDANFNTIAVHTPSDAVFSAAGWTFTSWSADDSIRIFGTSAAETIIGSSKSTVIFGDDGADILIGGNSDDLFAYASGTHADAGEIVNGGGGIDTISGPGNTSDFTQVTLSSIERLTNSALSTMTFSGGQIGSGAITQVDGGNTGGLALIINGATVNLSSVTFSGWTGGNSITINGTAGGNALTGSNQIDIINGGPGADLMRGLGGSDNYIVDNAGDIVDETATGSDGSDTVFASVSFALADGVENLKLTGSALNGTGNGLANVITGDAAANILDGQAGADTMRGLGGSDNYIVDNAGDIADETATGSDGSDTVFASVSFALADGVENLKLTGSALNGTGNALANVITGDAAANILKGLGGDDTIDGGGGANDTAVYSGAWVSYTITNLSGVTTITDKRGSSPDGIDTVTNVEQFIFSNGTFAASSVLNDAPTDIALSGTHTVTENAANGTVVGVLSAADLDTPLGDTATYTLVAPDGRFAISGATNLVVANSALLNFEAATSHAVTIRVTDAKGLTHDELFIIGVTDTNDAAPVFSSGTTGSVAENTAATTVVYDANATDGDGTPPNKIITYSLAGADAARFLINPATGEVRFATSPDFEAPSDGGANNAYDIAVRASDGANITNLGVSISVTDLSEGQPTPGNDTISGTGANEAFNGGRGDDILTGKGGADLFFFDSKLNKKSNVDHITDFTVGVDNIQLDRSIFKKLKPGELSAKAFTSGKVQKDDRILYDKQSGVMSFDKDGKGGAKATKFAVLDGSPDNLSAADFVIVA